jgi:hypothetical protein
MITFGKTKCKVRILYKSGNTIEMWFYEFNIDKRGSEVVSASYTPSEDFEKVLALGIDNVEAIYQIGAKVNVFTRIKQLLTFG